MYEKMNNHTEAPNITSDDSPCQESFQFVWLGVVILVVCLLGYVGNVLCLVVLHRARRRTVTFLLLKALAAADLLYLLSYSCMRVWPELLPPYSIFPYMQAYLWPVVSMLLSTTTWLMVLVTMHRYIVVCHPLNAQYRSTLQVARAQIVIVIIVAILIDIPRFFELRVEHEQDKVPVLKKRALYEGYYYHILYKNGLVLTYRKLLPLAITITLTVRLITSLYQARATRRYELRQTLRHSHEQRITKALLAVVIVFIVCQMPGAIYPVLRLFLNIDHQECGTGFYYLLLIADGLTIVNSAVNFLIYMLCSQEFRNSLSRLSLSQTTSTISKNTDNRQSSRGNNGTVDNREYNVEVMIQTES